MDEKRRQAFLNATKKMMASNTSDADILSSLSELGVGEDDANMLIRDVKKQSSPAAETKISPREVAMASDGNAWKESIEKRIQEEKQRYISAKEDGTGERKMPEDEFPKHFISKGEGDQYIPQLKTGGREKIKEIIVESQIGKVEAKKTPGPPKPKKAAAPKETEDDILQTEKKIIEQMARIERKMVEIEREIRAKGGAKGKAGSKVAKKAVKIAAVRKTAAKKAKPAPAPKAPKMQLKKSAPARKPSKPKPRPKLNPVFAGPPIETKSSGQKGRIAKKDPGIKSAGAKKKTGGK